jgi:ABC-2 type transport system permease protein
MHSFKAAYINELVKFSKKKKLIVAALLSIFVVMIGGLIVYSLDSFIGVRITGSSDFSLLMLKFLSMTLIPLFTAFICIDMFNGEYTAETIKMVLTRPVSRAKVYCAKLSAAATFILFNLLFSMVISTLVSLIVKGEGVEFGKILVAYLVTFLPLMVFACFVVVVANFARGGASAFLISAVLFLALLICQMVFSSAQSFFFTSTFGWHQLFISSFINWQKILRVFLILIGCGTMLFAGGLYLFEQKEF